MKVNVILKIIRVIDDRIYIFYYRILKNECKEELIWKLFKSND